jgi:4-carboxymuconolactone decarboxylase
MTMATELDKKGKELRARLWGEEAIKSEYLKEFDEKFATFLNEQLFGEIWNRPGLPTRTRSLITVTALMALGRGPELRLHMRGALNLGITPDELKEVIIHISQYSGIPSAIEAIRAFNEVTAARKQ